MGFNPTGAQQQTNQANQTIMEFCGILHTIFKGKAFTSTGIVNSKMTCMNPSKVNSHHVFSSQKWDEMLKFQISFPPKLNLCRYLSVSLLINTIWLVAQKESHNSLPLIMKTRNKLCLHLCLKDQFIHMSNATPYLCKSRLVTGRSCEQ